MWPRLSQTSATNESGGGFSSWQPCKLKCKECGADYRARGALRLRALLRPARGRLRARRPRTSSTLRRRIQAGPQNIWRYADFLPLEGPQPRTAHRACPPAARRWCAPTASPSASACARCGSRTTPPTRRTRSRTASSRSPLARARELGFDDARLRLDRQPRQRGRRPRRRARLESYVFIPADLEEQKILATGVYGTNLVEVQGNYDDVNRLCTELSRRARLGVRQRQRAPVLRRGLQDARPTRSPSSSAGSCPTASSRRSPPARCSPRSPRASRSGSTLGLVDGRRCRR